MTVQIPCMDGGTLAIMNIHNYGLTERHLHDTRRTVRTHLRKAHAGPASLFLVAGDHTAPATDTTSAHISSAGHTRACPRQASTLTWKTIFDLMIEISTQRVTRLHTYN